MGDVVEGAEGEVRFGMIWHEVERTRLMIIT